MPGIRGSIQATFRTREVENASKRAILRAMQEVAAELEATIKSTINHQTGPYGPSSPPGTPPYKRTGNLHDNFRITANPKGLNVWTVPYGPFLEGGTSKMAPRPFVGPILRGRYGSGLLRKSWDQEIARRARKYTGRNWKG